jgi:hypothetical protein
MKSLELTKPVTTESLLSEFESRFNQTLDVSKYTKEELEDTANHIRTKIHNITQNTHFGQELKNEDYQKNQMMLDIVNQAITEYGMNTDPKTQKMVDKIQKVSGLQDKEKKEIIGDIVTKEEVKEVASEPMGADDTMDMDTDLDSLDSEGGEETDEFGASDAEAGGTEPEGREQRESKEVFEASNRLYSKLAGK